MLRISGGEFKNASLSVPRGIRATGAKVRQAIYNILNALIEGARVLDGFAGSGALGIEALSRGAAFVAFIDSDAEAVLSIRENLERLSIGSSREAWRLMQTDIEQGMRHLAKTEAPFDVILLDPPYRTDLGKKALKAIGDYAMLAPAGIVAIEHDQRTTLPLSLGTLHTCKRHRYGDTVLSFYQTLNP